MKSYVEIQMDVLEKCLKSDTYSPAIIGYIYGRAWEALVGAALDDKSALLDQLDVCDDLMKSKYGIDPDALYHTYHTLRSEFER